MHKTIRSLSLLCAAGVVLHAQGRTERPITQGTVVDTSGSYVLVQHLFARGSEPALTIRTSGVSVDLNGFTISGPGTNTGTGILIDSATGVTLKNGHIRDLGFGVTVMNSNAVVIEGLHVTGRGLAVSAPPPEVGIMLVNSKAVTVRHNRISGVGLGVFVRGPGSMGNHIYENTITATTNGLLGVCYNPAPGAPGGPRGDLVASNVITGFRFAIQVNAGGPNAFRDNALFYTMGAFEIAAGNVVLDEGNTKAQLP